MREVKFKGKRVDNGEWVYGLYHKNVGIGDILIRWEEPKKDCLFNNHWILVHKCPTDSGWTISDTYNAYSIIPESISQFTGSKDKNGKEIYENDIINGACFNGSSYAYGKVVYSKYQFVIYPLGRIEGYAEFLYPEHFEVIGNIIDNPELL